MLFALVALYALVGFAYYLSMRRAEGPQGIPSFLMSLALGGFTVTVLLGVAIVAVLGYGAYLAIRNIRRLPAII